MIKSVFRKINFSLMIFSIFCLFLFLWLSDNYKDNIILWVVLPLLMIDIVYMTYQFIKEKSSFPEEIIDVSFILSALKVSWKTDKSSIINIFLQEFCFIFFVCAYNYGYLIIPFCVFTLTNFIQSFIEKVDKKRLECN